MATVTFSVPDEIEEAFQETFANENRNAIIARLMKEAVDDRKRQEPQAVAIDALSELRRKQRPASDKEIARARRSGRP